MPERLARRAGVATGRASVLSKTFFQDRDLAVRQGLQESGRKNRLAQLQEELQIRSQFVKMKQNEDRILDTKKALSQEIGITRALSGEGLGDLANDPDAVIAFSEARREKVAIDEKARVKAAATAATRASDLFNRQPADIRAFLTAEAVDTSDEAAVQAGAAAFFEQERAKAAQKTAKELEALADKEFRKIFEDIQKSGTGAVAEFLKADQELEAAVNSDGTIVMRRLRNLLRQKWKRQSQTQRSEDLTAATPAASAPPAASATDQFDQLKSLLGTAQ